MVVDRLHLLMVWLKIKGDRLNGKTSRMDVANACIESLFNNNTIDRSFSIINSGTRPVNIDWSQLFAQL